MFCIEFLHTQNSFFESLLTYKYNLDFSCSRIIWEQHLNSRIFSFSIFKFTVDAFRRDFSIFEFIVPPGRISSRSSWVSESGFEFSDPLVSAALTVVSSRIRRNGYCRRSVCTDGGRVSSNSSDSTSFSIRVRAQAARVTASGLPRSQDEGPMRESVSVIVVPGWLLRSSVREGAGVAKFARSSLDMGWYYPAGGERETTGSYRRLRSFFRPFRHRREMNAITLAPTTKLYDAVRFCCCLLQR